MSEIALKVKGISKSFGGVKAVQNVSFEVKKDRISGLIGPNGAGKTTAFNLITGMDTADSGEVIFKDKDLIPLAPHKIVPLGMSRTFQNIRLLAELSVIDNVKIGFHTNINYNLIHTMFRLPKFHRREREMHEKSRHLLIVMTLDKFVGRKHTCHPNSP